MGDDQEGLARLLALPAVEFPRVSTDRTRVGCLWNPEGRIELFVLPLDGGAPHQVTYGTLPTSPRTPLVWSPDDRSMLLGIDSEGNELHDLVEFEVATGNSTHLTSNPTCERWPLAYFPDGRAALYASDRGLPGERRQIDLWRVPVDGGPEVRLTHHAQPVHPWDLRHPIAPDGRHLVYAASDSANPRDLAVYLAEADGGRPERVLSIRDGSKEQPVAWSPDGRSVAVSSDAFERTRTGVLDVASRQVRWIEQELGDDVPVEFSPDSSTLLLVRAQGVRSRAILVDLTTFVETSVPIATSIYTETAFLPDGGGVISVRESSDRPNEVVSWSRGGGVRVHLAARWAGLDPRSLRPAQVVRYPSFDGRTIEALLFEPHGRDDGRPHPAIVEAHGGPTYQFYDEFSPWAQYFAQQGIAVLMPNVRGSTGYGSTFRDLNLLDLGGGDLADLAAGVDFLKGLGYVDPERIGIEGVSYGGFLTYLALVKRPELFRAGCAVAGVTDWPLCYAQEAPALQQADRELLGDPEERRALWADRSPVNFADQLRAPILMIHGANDPRCPVDQARVFRDALVKAGRVEGRDFEYLEFSDEGHWSWDAAELLRTFGPMAEFFDRHFARPDVPAR